MADQRPKFRNVEPRSRQERLANNDKEMLEKLRLEHRRGGAYRYNNPGNIIQPPEDSAAFMSEGERFGTNAAQEEYENRRRRILEREEYLERKREANYQRETARWHKVDLEGQWEDEALAELKEGPVPTRNKSSVKYNFITLQYEESYDGETLKYKDDIVRRNAALRAGKINHMRMAESRTDYDVITGLPKPAVRVPVPELGPAPVAPVHVEREKPEAYRVDMQYGVGDAAVRETHEKEDWSREKAGTWGR